MERGAPAWKSIAGTALTPVVAIAAYVPTRWVSGPYFNALPQAWVQQAHESLGEDLAGLIVGAPVLIFGVGVFLALYALMRRGLGLPFRTE
jgi:hypothetical protein